jgi:glycerol-3-phosphate dehydrogenase
MILSKALPAAVPTVHGGVRYLQQSNISLVHEALRERGLRCENAPHLVHHLAFIVPIYSWREGPFYAGEMKEGRIHPS